QAILVSSPSVSSSANCASSLASAMLPGRSPSPNEKLQLAHGFSLRASGTKKCRWQGASGILAHIHSLRWYYPGQVRPVGGKAATLSARFPELPCYSVKRTLQRASHACQ